VTAAPAWSYISEGREEETQQNYHSAADFHLTHFKKDDQKVCLQLMARIIAWSLTPLSLTFCAPILTFCVPTPTILLPHHSVSRFV